MDTMSLLVLVLQLIVCTVPSRTPVTIVPCPLLPAMDTRVATLWHDTAVIYDAEIDTTQNVTTLIEVTKSGQSKVFPIDGLNLPSRPTQIARNRDWVAFLVRDSLIAYNLRDKTISHLPLHDSYIGIQLIGDTAVVWDCGYLSPKGWRTKLAFVNLHNGGPAWTVALPLPRAAAFTFFLPRRDIAISRHRIFVSDIAPYSVRVYDWQGAPIDSIQSQPMRWRRSALSASVDTAQSVAIKPLLDSIRSSYYNSSTISDCYALSDSNLIIRWRTGNKHTDGPIRGKDEVVFDRWVKDEHGWTLIAETSQSPTMDDSVLTTFPILDEPTYATSALLTIEDLPAVQISPGTIWETFVHEGKKLAQTSPLQTYVVFHPYPF